MPTKRCCCGCVDPPECTLTGESDCNVGDYVELTWTTTGADTVALTDEEDNVLSTSKNGTLLIPDGACITYTLTATNDCGTSTCSYYCCDCDGCTPNPSPVPCEDCADGDDPVSYSTPRDWQISISGLAAGTSGSCGFLGLDTCEINAAGTNNAFFNGDIVLGPCDNTILDDCVFICEFNDAVNFIPYGYTFEFNRIEITTDISGPVTSVGALVTVTVHIESWIGTLISGIPRTEEQLCDRLRNDLFFIGNETPLGSSIGSHKTYSHRIRIMRFERTTGAFEQWTHELATCPSTATDSVTEELCNSRIYIPACVGEGWEVTEVSDVLVEKKGADAVTVCAKANDVGSATITVEAV